MKTIQKLVVSEGKCIGCRACTSMCPAGMITLADENEVRTIRFPITCAEDCERCAEVCSESAIKLQPASESSEEIFALEFSLIASDGCWTPFATEPMIDKVRSSLSTALHPVEPFWTNSCICCRKKHTAAQEVGKKKAVGQR